LVFLGSFSSSDSDDEEEESEEESEDEEEEPEEDEEDEESEEESESESDELDDEDEDDDELVDGDLRRVRFLFFSLSDCFKRLASSFAFALLACSASSFDLYSRLKKLKLDSLSGGASSEKGLFSP
jgi:cobalamin biosynthesis protein CobT